MILSNGEITTDGFTLGFDERMNTNLSKFKRLGIRKIKCELLKIQVIHFGLLLFIITKLIVIFIVILLTFILILQPKQ
jgi:hypothetical protein